MTEALVVIPPPWAPARLPEKRLAEIAGVPMIVHVWRRASEARIGPVVVATDSRDIAGAVQRAGGRAVLTRAHRASGSDRIHEAVGLVDAGGRFDRIVNVQGDLPTLDPAAIRVCPAPLDDREVDIATLAAEIRRDEERANPNVVKVIGSEVAPGRLRALYFTR